MYLAKTQYTRDDEGQSLADELYYDQFSNHLLNQEQTQINCQISNFSISE